MEEKEQKLTLHDISQALAGASDEEMAEFVTTWVSKVKNPLDTVVFWDVIPFEKQRAQLESAPWMMRFLPSKNKVRFFKRLRESEAASEEKPQPEPKTEPAPEPTTKKAPWWMFWK